MKAILIALLSLSTIAYILPREDTDLQKKKIKPQASTIVWTGKKVSGQHRGTVDVSQGIIAIDKGILVGGNVTIDMTTIACTDLKNEGAQQLVGHLKSDDFFGVPHHPTATFVITEVQPTRIRGQYETTGDLTIKGITKQISTQVTMTDQSIKALLTIDRTVYNIKYGSGSFFDNLGNRMIYDDFELEMLLAY